MNDKIYYEMAGHFSSRGEWTHPSRTIETYEYIFVADGNAFIEENGKRYAIEKGEVLLLCPGLCHFGYAPSREPVSFFWVHFYGDIDPSLLPKHASPECAPRLAVLFRQLLHYTNDPHYPSLAADLTVRLILTELSSEFAQNSGKTTSLYERVCEWCRINSDRKLTAADVASHFGYNKDYLNRMFVKFGGIGLKEYINEKRIEKIRANLLADNLTLKQIAKLSGFDDYKDFLKFFRYHEGITPTEFRNLYYKTHTNNR